MAGHFGAEPDRASGCMESMGQGDARVGSRWIEVPRIALGDAACDRALGGGLACGALHEIRGVSFGEGEGLHASGDAGDTGDGWIVPFGSLLHVVRAAMGHPALHACPVAWIGSKVHPSHGVLGASQPLVGALHGRRAGCAARLNHADLDGLDSRASSLAEHWLDGELERRSVFIADVAPGVWKQDRFAEASVPPSAGPRRAGRCSDATDRARARLWCAELALALDAVGVLVVDGSGFDHLAWRRLQLAVTAARQRSRDGNGATDGAPPLVLIVTPPDRGGADSGRSDRHARHGGRFDRRLRTAATRWSVRAESCAGAGSVGVDGATRSGVGPLGADGELRFRWRMELTHMRTGCGGQFAPPCTRADGEPANAIDGGGVPGDGDAHDLSVQAAIANRQLSVSVEMPRTSCADDAWIVLRSCTDASRPAAEAPPRGAADAVWPAAMQGLRVSSGRQPADAEDADLFVARTHRIHRGWEVRSA